ncbi:hypothetical protein DITRI_Ditri09bG0057800 [Diplodiscus trichospermus]
MKRIHNSSRLEGDGCPRSCSFEYLTNTRTLSNSIPGDGRDKSCMLGPRLSWPSVEVSGCVLELTLQSFKWQLSFIIWSPNTVVSWFVTKGGNTVRKPGVTFPDGLHIEISEKHKC